MYWDNNIKATDWHLYFPRLNLIENIRILLKLKIFSLKINEIMNSISDDQVKIYYHSNNDKI